MLFRNVNSNESPNKAIIKRVWITSSELLSEIIDLLPLNKGRQSLVSSLIQAYGLDGKCDDIIGVTRIRRRNLETFHGKQFLDMVLKRRTFIDASLSFSKRIQKNLQLEEYKDVPKNPVQSPDGHIDIIKLGEELNEKYTRDRESDCEDDDTDLKLSESDGEASIFEDGEIQDEDTGELESYGLLHDCYVFPFMPDYVKLVAASSICTAIKLTKERKVGDVQNIAINWYGGRHHCKKNKAAGFCYINDIVLSINILRGTYRKIFYLDLDLHHGDGVESAFEYSKNVMTCSIHRYDIAFYPGTGSLSSTLENKVNIPVMKGLSDDNMLRIIAEVVIPLISNFQPDVLVIQAGCDGLSTDDHKEWNMTIKGYGKVLRVLLDNIGNISVMILGGGGYNHTETAKCWAYLTKITVAEEEEENEEWDIIPDHKYLDTYHYCGFRFWTDENLRPTKMKDENHSEYIDNIKKYILDKCIK